MFLPSLAHSPIREQFSIIFQGFLEVQGAQEDKATSNNHDGKDNVAWKKAVRAAAAGGL